jgi:hypothetical protein
MAPMAGRPEVSEGFIAVKLGTRYPTAERPLFIAAALITRRPRVPFKRGTELRHMNKGISSPLRRATAARVGSDSVTPGY